MLGRVRISESVLSERELKKRFRNIVDAGGEHAPGDCVSRTNVAIIIPFRNRGGQLRFFLNHIHSFLTRQELHYRIYIINQVKLRFFEMIKIDQFL